MASKELINKVALSSGITKRQAEAAISTILAALLEPTEGMLAASGDGHLGRWKDILAASALGEQSE